MTRGKALEYEPDTPSGNSSVPGTPPELSDEDVPLDQRLVNVDDDVDRPEEEEEEEEVTEAQAEAADVARRGAVEAGKDMLMEDAPDPPRAPPRKDPSARMQGRARAEPEAAPAPQPRVTRNDASGASSPVKQLTITEARAATDGTVITVFNSASKNAKYWHGTLSDWREVRGRPSSPSSTPDKRCAAAIITCVSSAGNCSAPCRPRVSRGRLRVIVPNPIPHSPIPHSPLQPRLPCPHDPVPLCLGLGSDSEDSDSDGSESDHLIDACVNYDYGSSERIILYDVRGRQHVWNFYDGMKGFVERSVKGTDIKYIAEERVFRQLGEPVDRARLGDDALTLEAETLTTISAHPTFGSLSDALEAQLCAPGIFVTGMNDPEAPAPGDLISVDKPSPAGGTTVELTIIVLCYWLPFKPTVFRPDYSVQSWRDASDLVDFQSRKMVGVQWMLKADGPGGSEKHISFPSASTLHPPPCALPCTLCCLPSASICTRPSRPLHSPHVYPTASVSTRLRSNCRFNPPPFQSDALSTLMPQATSRNRSCLRRSTT